MVLNRRAVLQLDGEENRAHGEARLVHLVPAVGVDVQRVALFKSVPVRSLKVTVSAPPSALKSVCSTPLSYQGVANAARNDRTRAAARLRRGSRKSSCVSRRFQAGRSSRPEGH